MTDQRPPRLLDSLFRTDRMRAAFSDEARLQGMLDFEAALAKVQAALGVIPSGGRERDSTPVRRRPFRCRRACARNGDGRESSRFP